MDLLTELNKRNAYSNKIEQVLYFVQDHYLSMSAKAIYDKACEINSYSRPVPYSVINLHYTLIHLINIMYKLREIDSAALDYCLLICDMDISLYDEIRKVSIKELHNDFVYAGSLSRKIIILEKHGEYQQAIDLCDFAINNEYKNGVKDDNSNSFIKQKNRIMNKLAKTPTKDTISHPKK